jgi:hypothetical protein
VHARRPVAFLVAAATLVTLPASAGLAERGAPERPVTATAAGRLSSPPQGGVAGTGSTVTVGTKEGSGGGGTSVSFALLLGGLVAAILLISVAALPATVTSRLARGRVDRLDIALAGALVLLVVTLVYLASVL